MLFPAILLLSLFILLAFGFPRRSGDEATPNRALFRIPVIGSALFILWDIPGFFSYVQRTRNGTPLRLPLYFVDLYIVTSVEMIRTALKDPGLHIKAYKSLSVVNMFGMSSKGHKLFLTDNSGLAAAPKPGSKVPAHLRVDYMTYHSSHSNLTGPALRSLTENFISNLTEQLKCRQEITVEWTTLPDLWIFVREEYAAAAIKAMCGTNFLKMNPTFIKKYWEFSENVHVLAKRWPRFLSPRPYQLRDSCRSMVMEWHKAIQPHLQDSGLDQLPWNPFYGTPFIKSRQRAWNNMPDMDPVAAGAEDLGLLWAANGNSVPVSYWMIVEVISRPELLAAVRNAVKRYRTSGPGALGFNWETLCADPLLSAVYAEAMRTRVASLLMRSPEKDDFQLGRTRVPRDAVILISGHHAQNDSRVWDPCGTYPVEEFWPERFLTFSDPQRRRISGDSDWRAEFTMGNRHDAWLPFGGGQRMCTGRHFAKQEMIAGLTVTVTLFDLEIQRPDGIPKSDMRGFGFGALLPLGEMPVKIRLSSQL